MDINNKNYQEAKMEGTVGKLKLRKLTYCNFVHIVNNMKILSEHNCRESNDLLLYTLS